MGVAGEGEDLVLGGGLGEDGGDRLGPPGVEVDEDVVEDEGEGHRLLGEGGGEGEAQAQVELLGRPPAEPPGVHPAAVGTDGVEAVAPAGVTLLAGDELDVAAVGDLAEELARPAHDGRLALPLVAGERRLEEGAREP